MIDLEKMSKEHEKLFPKATLESQCWKLEEEVNEIFNAISWEDKEKEVADVIIVCGGLYRWCPNLAKIILHSYLSAIDKDNIEYLVNRKRQINLKRKWEWNGKTYHHVGEEQ